MTLKKVFMILAVVAVFAASFTMASDGATTEPASGGVAYGALAAGYAIAIAAALGALAQGKVVAAGAEGVARNPSAAGDIKFLLILGLAFIESLVIYALVIAFMIAGK